MPFIKKNDAGGSAQAGDAQKIFIARSHELHFFLEHVLQPEDPLYNIISIYGDGGVGKSTLLGRYNEEAQAPGYKEYCLTAFVDERQATPASMMERFADQLGMRSEFRRALQAYKDALRKLHTEQETMEDAVLQHAPDFAGAAVEGVPFVGPLLREGIKFGTAQAINRYHVPRPAERLEDPIGDLTRAFVTELNHLAEAQVMLSGRRVRRRHRVLLFFDTFEQLKAAQDYALNCQLASDDIRACWMAEWIAMCQQRADEATAARLEEIAASQPQHYFAYVCRGVAGWLRGQSAEAALDDACRMRATMWDAFFWRGLIRVASGQAEGIEDVERALQSGMFPVLLAPLSWLEQDRPDVYATQVLPLLRRYQ